MGSKVGLLNTLRYMKKMQKMETDHLLEFENRIKKHVLVHPFLDRISMGDNFHILSSPL